MRFWITLLFMCSVAQSAAAFKENGHRAIEAAAYARLIESHQASSLAALVRAGILDGHLPETNAQIVKGSTVEPDSGMDAGLENIRGLRVASNFPDHSFDRQLQAYGQCFHFMAEGRDVTGTDEADYGVTLGMERDAYQRCVGLADALLRGILFDPAEAKKQHLDVYVLIHLIEDSFSGAHVERDMHWKIMYLKPWRLETWIPYFFAPSAWKYYVTEAHHGGFVEDRDYGYLDAACGDQEGTPVVSVRCLSQRGRRAADAIAELLLLMAKYAGNEKNPPYATQSRCRAAACNDFEHDWNEYKKRHLSHAQAKYSAELSDAEATSDLRAEGLLGPSAYVESTSFHTLGLGLATDFTIGQALWLDADVFELRDVVSRNALSFLDFCTLSVQLRLPLADDQGQRPFGAAIEGGLRIPTGLINDPQFAMYLSIHVLRLAIGAASVAPGIAEYTFEPGFGGMGLDVVVLNKLWVSADWPRKLYRLSNWTGGQWEPAFWTLKVGTVIDGF